MNTIKLSILNGNIYYVKFLFSLWSQSLRGGKDWAPFMSLKEVFTWTSRNVQSRVQPINIS